MPVSLPYFDLTGKVAVITGGATGIGRGIADGLADAGADIVLGARRLEVLEEACQEIAKRTGARTFPQRFDITSSEEIRKLVKNVVGECGHIDILVNSAGIGGNERPILEMTEEDWDSLVDVNLRGVFTMSQAVVRQMVEQGTGGKIINVGSILGQIATPNMAAYCASKGGIIQLTKVMALEWVRYDIQVNAILAGYVETPMNTAFFSGEAGKKLIRKSMPLGRIGQKEEMRGLAVFLASPASSFMTGSNVVMDGGQSAW